MKFKLGNRWTNNKDKLKLPTKISFKAKITINDTADLSKQEEELCYLFIDVTSFGLLSFPIQFSVSSCLINPHP